MESIYIINSLGAAFTVIVAVITLVKPTLNLDRNALAAKGVQGLSGIRSLHGGPFLALGSFALAVQIEIVFLTVAMAWLGAALVRLISFTVPENRNAKQLSLMNGEIGIAVLLLL